MGRVPYKDKKNSGTIGEGSIKIHGVFACWLPAGLLHPCGTHPKGSQCAPSARRFCAVGMPWAGPMRAFGAPAERRPRPPLRGPDWTGFDTPTDRLGRCYADLTGLAPNGLPIPSTWSTMTAPRLALRPADHQQTYY